MATTIIDGTGKSYSARVDDEGRMFVVADVVPHPQHHSMSHQNLFLLDFCTTLPDSNETPVAIFKNLDSDIDFEFYITQINSNADVDVKFYFGDGYTSGGTLIVPKNLNLGSGIGIAATRAIAYEGGTSGDLVLDTTNRVHAYNMYLGARRQEEVDFQGGLIVTNGGSLSITAAGASGNKVCLLAMVSWHTSGTKL